MSLKDAEALVPELKLSKILHELVPSGYTPDRIIVMAPQYLKDLSKLVSDTSKETLHAYFLWKTIQSYYSFIEADAVVPIERFQNELSGQVRLPFRH
jgi:endothelin-converting enzyme